MDPSRGVHVIMAILVDADPPPRSQAGGADEGVPPLLAVPSPAPVPAAGAASTRTTEELAEPCLTLALLLESLATKTEAERHVVKTNTCTLTCTCKAVEAAAHCHTAACTDRQTCLCAFSAGQICVSFPDFACTFPDFACTK